MINWKRIAAAAVALILLLPVLTLAPRAAETARDISKSVTFSAEGFENSKLINDGKAAEGASSKGGSITLTAKENIGGLYMKFNYEPTAWSVTDGKKALECGEGGFYHEFVDISAGIGEAKVLTLTFPAEIEISEIAVYSVGETPENVQVWQSPHGEADLLLFSTHSDDDQLYFAGLIPYYVALGYKVQVAYLTNHPKEIHRRHELLDGLWTAGCRNYPILEDFPDFRIDDLNKTIAKYETLGVSYAALEEYVIETIRRTKPLVTVTHDVKGEYGHGMHLLLSKMVREAVEKTDKADIYPASAQEYGTWKMPKTYIHLYEKNKIVLDFDVPLDHFGGKSAFQMSQLAFKCHTSQQRWAMFVDWIYGKNKEITKATQITTYNPAHYGLYSSEVGADIAKNDMFENLGRYLLRDELGEKDSRIEELEAKLKELEEKLAALQLENGTLAAERDALLAQKEGLEGELESLKKELEALRKENEDSGAVEPEFTEPTPEGVLREQLDELRAEIERGQAEYDALVVLLIVTLIVASVAILMPIFLKIGKKQNQ